MQGRRQDMDLCNGGAILGRVVFTKKKSDCERHQEGGARTDSYQTKCGKQVNMGV